jgi:hypothetical protein
MEIKTWTALFRFEVGISLSRVHDSKQLEPTPSFFLENRRREPNRAGDTQIVPKITQDMPATPKQCRKTLNYDEQSCQRHPTPVSGHRKEYQPPPQTESIDYTNQPLKTKTTPILPTTTGRNPTLEMMARSNHW